LCEHSAKWVFGGEAENSLSYGPIAVSRLSCTKCQKNISTALALLAQLAWSLTMHFGSTISQLQAARPILLE